MSRSVCGATIKVRSPYRSPRYRQYLAIGPNRRLELSRTPSKRAEADVGVRKDPDRSPMTCNSPLHARKRAGSPHSNRDAKMAFTICVVFGATRRQNAVAVFIFCSYIRRRARRGPGWREKPFGRQMATASGQVGPLGYRGDRSERLCREMEAQHQLKNK
jgi:hypothetical protein